MGWYGFDHGMGVWGWVAMSAGLILVLGVLVLGGVLLARGSRRAPDGAVTQPAEPVFPEETLAERFARGEIDDEEYRRRLVTLREVAPR